MRHRDKASDDSVGCCPKKPAALFFSKVKDWRNDLPQWQWQMARELENCATCDRRFPAGDTSTAFFARCVTSSGALK